MKQSPCNSCEHKDLSKLKPFLWLIRDEMKRMPRDWENGTLSYIPGKNYPNPCYRCKKALEYSEYITDYLDLPPTTGLTTWTISANLIESSIFYESTAYADLEESVLHAEQ